MNTPSYLSLIIALMLQILSGCGAETTESPATDDECRTSVDAYPDNCLGPKLEDYYCGPMQSAVLTDPTTEGSSLPSWRLKDEQMQSCAHEQFYGLDAFIGTPTMVVLLWAGCSFCQQQAEKLQEMHFELTSEGDEIDFVIVNRAGPNPPIEALTDRCAFPIFQDVESVDAWAAVSGSKDDFFFYDSAGVLQRFISASDDINLSTESGYENVKSAALELMGQNR